MHRGVFLFGDNMGPSEDVPAADLFAALSARHTPSEVVDYPRKNGRGEFDHQVRVLVLTSGQHDEARLRAQERLKNRGMRTDDLAKSPLLQETLGDAVARELLTMALVNEKPMAGSDEGEPAYTRVFPTATHMENVCTSDELTALFNLYLMVQSKFGSLDSTVSSKEEFEAWINRLAEGGASYPLGVFSFHSLAEFCLSLAQAHWNLCRTLQSQSENLPSGLAAALLPLTIDTSSSGEPVESSTPEDDIEITPANAMELAGLLGEKPKRGDG